MADPLRISFVSTPQWGGASGREFDVPEKLVVFYGPNEVGKSSFATAIAVLLSGPALGSPELRGVLLTSELEVDFRNAHYELWARKNESGTPEPE